MCLCRKGIQEDESLRVKFLLYLEGFSGVLGEKDTRGYQGFRGQ